MRVGHLRSQVYTLKWYNWDRRHLAHIPWFRT
jgi:hypothetical protein